MVAIDFIKQQTLNANLNAMQQIDFTGNLNRKINENQNITDNTTTFFITKEAEKTNLDFRILNF